MKAKMRQIVATAADQGLNAKLSGNEIVIGSRTYFSNELSLIPSAITEAVKQEKRHR